MGLDNRRVVGQIAGDIVHLPAADPDPLCTVKEWHSEFQSLRSDSRFPMWSMMLIPEVGQVNQVARYGDDSVSSLSL